MLSLLSTLFLHRFFTGLGLAHESGFPKPLSPAAERTCIEKMAAGDREARNTLILHNLRLVVHVAKKYYSQTGEQDDLISIGTVGLIKAVDSYDPAKKIKLATFAARCIENEIFMHFRRMKRRNAEVSLQETLETDKDGNVLEIMDTLSYEEDLPEKLGIQEQVALLERELDNVLDEREKFIMVRRYGLRGHKTMTQREIAALCGISRSYISRIEKGALEKLRAALEA